MSEPVIAWGCPSETGRPFVFHVERDRCLERGDDAGVAAVDRAAELWNRPPEEWELDRATGESLAMLMRRLAREDEQQHYAITAAHLFLDEPVTMESVDLCMKFYRDPHLQTAHQLALQLALWMQHPLIEQMTHLAMEESLRLRRYAQGRIWVDQDPEEMFGPDGLRARGIRPRPPSFRREYLGVWPNSR